MLKLRLALRVMPSHERHGCRREERITVEGAAPQVCLGEPYDVRTRAPQPSRRVLPREERLSVGVAYARLGGKMDVNGPLGVCRAERGAIHAERPEDVSVHEFRVGSPAQYGDELSEHAEREGVIEVGATRLPVQA